MLLAATMAALLGNPMPSHAIAGTSLVVNEYGMYFPGDFRYPQLRLEVPEGDHLIFLNLDNVIGAHAISHLRQPGDIRPVLFESAPVDPEQQTEVIGVDRLPVTNPETGEAGYPFYCPVHGPAFRGTLYIVPPTI